MRDKPVQNRSYLRCILQARLQEIFLPRNTISCQCFAPQTLSPPPFFLESEKSRKQQQQTKTTQGHVPQTLGLCAYPGSIWRKLSRFVFHNVQRNGGTPSFRSMRLAQNKDFHALNQLGVPKDSSLLLSNSLPISTFGILSMNEVSWSNHLLSHP